MKFIDLTGQKFGKLLVVRHVGKSKDGHSKWVCKCDCGETTIVIGKNLRRGTTQSCGCLQKEKSLEAHKKYNTYDLSGEFGIGFTFKDEEFYFDLDDYDKIKNFCWFKDKDGYISTNIENNSTQTKLHKIIFNYDWDKYIPDHIDRNTVNYRKDNIRICTQLENGKNKSKSIRNTSGFIGVSLHKLTHKWQASIHNSGKHIYLGLFIDIEDAVKARLKAEKHYFGDFAPQKHLFEKYNIQ